ncbi:Replication-associated protein, partial [human gut metagenome]
MNYIDDNDYLKIVEKITKKERTTQNKENKKSEITYETTEISVILLRFIKTVKLAAFME